MEERSKYLFKNTSIFAIGSLGTKLIGFVLVPFYTHILSTEQYGTVDLLFTIATIVVPLIMFNLGEAIMRFALDDDADQKKLFSVAEVCILFGIIISLLVIPIVSLFSIIKEFRVYLYFYIVLYAIKEILNGFLRGWEKLKLYVSNNILYSLSVALLNILFLAVLHMGIKGYLLAYIISEGICVCFAFFAGRMYYYLGTFILDWKVFRAMIRFSLAVIPNTLLWWVINSSDRVMVTAMCGTSENGLLAVGYKFPSILTVLNTVLMQAWKYSAIREKDSADRNQYANAMMERFLKISILVSGTLIVTLKPLSKVLFADEFFLSWKSGVILLAGFVFMGVGTFLGTVYYVEKNMLGNMFSALFGAIINVVLNWALIPFMGAAGATLAATVAYFSIMIFRHIDTKKYQSIQLFRWDYLVLFLLLITMTIGQFIETKVGIIVSFAGYAVMTILCYRFIGEMIKTGWKIINRRHTHEDGM